MKDSQGTVNRIWQLFGLVLASLIVLAGCDKGVVQAKKSMPVETVPVQLGAVVQKAMPVEIRTIGTVQAYSIVSIKTLVNGEIVKVDFAEGQDVKRGDMLFEIDPRPYQQALRGAEAALAKDQAQIKQFEANIAKSLAQAQNAKVQADRYARLVQQGVASKEQNDTFQSSADAMLAANKADEAALESARAALASDRAAIEKAKLDLEYCAIRAPISGRTGNLLVHEGNVVKANDIALVVINQVQPVFVALSVPGQYLPDVKKYMTSGRLKVRATAKEGGQAEVGDLDFVDNAIDVNTGTIQLKGKYSNENRTLWPGQFVDTVLTLTTQSDAIVIPAQAVQTSQQGQFVYVVKPDQTVESRSIVVGRTVTGETVVQKGLQPGERVVTDGQLRLVPGSKIREVKRSQETQS
jgi:multidrug efflux system membrane fusion protein